MKYSFFGDETNESEELNLSSSRIPTVGTPTRSKLLIDPKKISIFSPKPDIKVKPFFHQQKYVS